jgi:hypothetical protein
VDLDLVRQGQRPSCVDGPQAVGCRRVFDNALRARDEQPGGLLPDVHAFQGDTLFVMEQAAGLRWEDSRGAILAWRPGWAQAQPVTGPRGYWCEGHRRSAAAYCAEEPARRTSGPALRFDLKVGRLDAPESRLTMVAQLVASQPGDRAQGSLRYRIQISGDGRHVLYSNATGEPGTREPLRAVATDDPANIRQLSEDLHRWESSADGRAVYGLAGVPAGEAGEPLAGELHQVMIADGWTGSLGPVLDFALVGDDPAAQGLAAVSGGGQLWLKRDPNVRGAPTVIDGEARWIRAWSRDGGHIAYTRSGAFAGYGDLHVVRVGGSAPVLRCSITTKAWWNMAFSSSGEWLFWLDHPSDEGPRAHATHIASCRTVEVARNFSWWQRVPGDNFVVWTDANLLGTYGHANLRRVDLSRGIDAAATTMLSEAVSDRAVFVEWEASAPGGAGFWALYARQLGWPSDGLYA